MRRGHVSASDGADASVGGQHDDGRKCGLKRAIEEGEALDVEHMHLIDEQHSRHQLSHTLIDIPIDYLVYLRSQLLSHLSLLRLHDLAHQAHEVVAALRTGVGHVQVMQGHVLHDLLLLVHIALRKGNVLLGLEIELACVGVASAHALHVACRRLDVYHIADRALLAGEVLVDGRIEFELLGSLGGLEGDYDANDDLVARGQVVSLFGL